MQTKPPVSKIDPVRALAMYDEGASDNAIAKAFGVTQSGVCRWRKRNGLTRAACNDNRVTSLQLRRAKNMLRNGATRAQVAAHLGICRHTVQRIRRRMNEQELRPTGVGNKSFRAAVIRDDSLPHRIEKAIGMHVPIDIRMDAVSEMYLELLEGKLPISEIERSAARFRSKAFDLSGYSWSATSLDAEDDDGLSLADTLADPHSLDAFESILVGKFSEES